MVNYLRHAEVPVGELIPFPGNARTGDSKAIRDSLRRYGQYRALVVRQHDGQLTVLAGNHTREALAALAADLPPVDELLKTWPAHKRPAYEESARAFRDQLERGTARCEVIECSDDEAGRINVADNKYGEMPDPESGQRYDVDLLVEQLAGMDGDFGGTGWTAEDLEKLTAPETMPDPGDADTGDEEDERWGVIVECKTEAQQISLLETLSAEGYGVRAIMS